jgi:zinc protease
VEQAGISSLLLRTSLRGAGSMSAGKLSRFAESLGGAVTPLMMLGWVGWGVSVRADALRDAAGLLLEVARDPTLDPDAFETEKALQTNDAVRARDDMAGYPIRQVLERGLPDSWYGFPVMGEPETIENIGLDDLRGWAELLQTRRLTVVVVGDAAVEDLANRVMPLGAWPAVPVRAQPRELFEWAARRDVELRDKAQSAIATAFPAGTYHSKDRFPLSVAASILSGLAGRLFKELRDQRSLAYSVSASSWLRSRAGALLTYIAASPSREDEAREQMLESLGRFTRDGFTEDELIRGRNYVAGQIQLRRQSTYAIAGDIISAWLYGDLEEIEEVPGQLRAVSASEVQEVAQRIFDPERRVEFTLRGGGGSPAT